jgi:hypothetical protein
LSVVDSRFALSASLGIESRDLSGLYDAALWNGLSRGVPDHDVGAGIVSRMQPDVKRSSDPEGDSVVFRIISTYNNVVSIRREKAATNLRRPLSAGSGALVGRASYRGPGGVNSGPGITSDPG